MEHLEASQILDLEQPRQLGPLFEQSKLHLSECAICRKAWLECQALKALALEASLEVDSRIRRSALQLARKVEVEERLSESAGPDAARQILLGKKQSSSRPSTAPLLVALLAMLGLVLLWRGVNKAPPPEAPSLSQALPFEFQEAPAAEAASGTAQTPVLPPQEAAEERELDGEARRMLLAHLNKENRAEPTEAPSVQATLVPTPVPTLVPTLVPTVPATALPTRVPTRVPTPLPSPVPTRASTPSPEKDESTVDLGQAPAELSVPLPELEVQLAKFSPSRGESAQLWVTLPEFSPIEIRVFDSNGKSVKLIADGKFGPGRVSFRFAGIDDAGQPLDPGAYYARVMTRWFSRVETLEKIP